MVTARPSLLAASLVRTLTATGFDVYLPTGLVPVEAHPHDRRHLHPVPATGHAAGHAGGSVETDLLGAVARTRRPLALAVLDQDQLDAGDLDIGVRALMDGWAGGHLLVIGEAPAPWNPVGHLVRRHARRPGAVVAPRVSLTVVHRAPGPASDREPVVRWSAALPFAPSPLQARRAAETGVAVTRCATRPARAGIGRWPRSRSRVDA